MLRILMALCLCALSAAPVAAHVDPAAPAALTLPQFEAAATVRPLTAPRRPVTLMRQVAQEGGNAPAVRYGPQEGDEAEAHPAATAATSQGRMRWLKARTGPVPAIGGIAIAVVLLLLIVFRLTRGRVRIEAGRSGRDVPRYAFIERTAHWMLAGSFAVLAVSGLFLSLGREYLVPVIGADVHGALAHFAQWMHRGVWWLFALSLALVFVFFVRHSIPLPRDFRWWRRGGALYRKGERFDAGKFDGGQKAVFWATVLLGAFVCATGISMLFPFQVALFATMVDLINATGIPGALGGPLDAGFAPHEEVQLAQLWHAIAAFALIAVALAHSFMRSLGMEGAAEAMYAGTVDENFARERCNRWAVAKCGQAPDPGPARPG